MKEVQIGLIGFGFMGTTHWGIYKGIKGAKIVALAEKVAHELLQELPPAS